MKRHDILLQVRALQWFGPHHSCQLQDPYARLVAPRRRFSPLASPPARQAPASGNGWPDGEQRVDRPVVSAPPNPDDKAVPKLWREELRRAWHELRGSSSSSAARAGAAVALGLFIGSQPIFGCHTPLVITLCMLLQLDALLAFVASNISNPFFAPFLISAEVQVGGYLYTGAAVPFNAQVAADTGLSGFARYAFSGAPVVGAGLALVGFLLVLVWVPIKRKFWPARVRQPYRLPVNAPPWWHAVEGIASRYAPVPAVSTPAQRTRFHYVRSKLLSDPVAKMLTALLGQKKHVFGQVLDIGSGRGQLPLLMLALERASSVHGIDWDEGKIAAANAAAKQPPPLAASFAVANMTA
ncbi:MAG TPA: DUF2062 domain-containing protein, partial [Sorangium sp.]|nr:DUF2062 domain-containing protein [Sorangium sp.]